MEKQSKYNKIVAEVSNCCDCNDIFASSRDKSSHIYLEHLNNCCHVNLWSYWQSSLSPEMLVIGQDWGALPNPVMLDTYTNSDTYRTAIYTGKSQTDHRLVDLFRRVFGIDILTDQRLFFTNSVFCYKTGNLNENVSKKWFDNCNSRYMGRLITLLNPKSIVTLGKYALDGLAKCGDIKCSDNRTIKLSVGLAELVEDPNQMWWNSFDGKTKVRLFPAFHTGAYSNKNRPLVKQLKDWERIKPYVEF